MRKFPKPILIVSKCLEFERCRWNGEVINEPLVRTLMPFVDFRPVCAEVEIGLGVPRDPVRVVLQNGERRLVQPASHADVTDKMTAFCTEFLAGVREVDGFLLKSRSPSCGIKDVKVYPGLEKVAAVERAAGFFGQAVLDRFSQLPIEDEGRLLNFNLRETFLTRIFAVADLRRVKRTGAMKELVDFQARHKLMLMAYNQTKMRELGRIVANPSRQKPKQLMADYEPVFHQALSTTPRKTSIINVLMHAFGYFSKELNAREKSYFLDLLEKYRQSKLPLSAINAVIKSWIARYDEEYLSDQAFFEPFPAEIIETRDSGKGLDI